jgi:branched-chain amino acid transport system ATP-binding protein
MTDGAELTVDELEVCYGELIALAGVSFTVPAGAVLALIGPNGAGKSSLGRALSGLVPARSGRMLLDDIDVTHWSADRVRRGGLAYVPEGRGIFPRLSVQDNLRMAARQAGGRSDRADAIERATATFPVLHERRRQLAGSLSGGEQQMLGLARALTVQPRAIVIDEMSLGLAPMMVEHVFESVRTINEQGITVVLIEQFVHRALALADRCVILMRGSVAWDGSAVDARAEVLDAYLGDAHVR